MRNSTSSSEQEARAVERRTWRASILESDKQWLQLSKEYSRYFRPVLYRGSVFVIVAGVGSIFYLGKASVICPAEKPPAIIDTTREVQIQCPKEKPSCVLRTKRDCKALDHDLPPNNLS